MVCKNCLETILGNDIVVKKGHEVVLKACLYFRRGTPIAEM